MNSGRRASRKTPPKKTPPAADRTVAETVDRRLNELRPAERRAAGTLLAYERRSRNGGRSCPASRG